MTHSSEDILACRGKEMGTTTYPSNLSLSSRLNTRILPDMITRLPTTNASRRERDVRGDPVYPPRGQWNEIPLNNLSYPLDLLCQVA
jgi:hypothetical protein